MLPWKLPLALLITLVTLTAAEPDKTPAPKAPVVEPPGNRLLDITVTTSRKRPAAGSDLEVLLHIKNISATTLFLDKKTSTLIYPSELTAGGKNGRNFTFFDGQSKGQFYALQPNDETIMFASTEDSSRANWWDDTVGAFSRYLSFTPSDYQLAAVVYYSSNPDEGDWHIMTRDITLPIGAPQWVVLFGAGLGGLCAYILFLRHQPVAAPPMQGTRNALRETGSALSSVLFALVATILLSRISETQFFVRVTIEDLWGALAVGFVSSYMGRGILDRLMSVPPARPARTQSAEEANVALIERETPMHWTAAAGSSSARILDTEEIHRS